MVSSSSTARTLIFTSSAMGLFYKKIRGKRQLIVRGGCFFWSGDSPLLPLASLTGKGDSPRLLLFCGRGPALRLGFFSGRCGFGLRLLGALVFYRRLLRLQYLALEGAAGRGQVEFPPEPVKLPRVY